MFTRIYMFKVDETKNLEKGKKKTKTGPPFAKTCEVGAPGGGGGLSGCLCGKATSSCTATSPGPQTPHRKPKQPSIIQQVQSEPAPEEKAGGWREWGGGVHPAWESVHKHVMWSVFAAGREPPRVTLVLPRWASLLFCPTVSVHLQARKEQSFLGNGARNGKSVLHTRAHTQSATVSWVLTHHCLPFSPSLSLHSHILKVKSVSR